MEVIISLLVYLIGIFFLIAFLVISFIVFKKLIKEELLQKDLKGNPLRNETQQPQQTENSEPVEGVRISTYIRNLEDKFKNIGDNLKKF